MGRSRHPCFTPSAHHRYARLHLPVAALCNIRCAYCDRLVGDCPHVTRPGVASRILGPLEVPALVRATLAAEPTLSVIGVAGPGEPLANPETFEALACARSAWEAEWPGLAPSSTPILCVSTNGLLLAEETDRLAAVGVSAVTVTLNAVTPAVGDAIYLDPGDAGSAEALIAKQLDGIRAAAGAGLQVKVNTVLVPGLNDGPEIAEIARAAALAGAVLHNVMPLIPLGLFASRRAPSCVQLREARREAGRFLPQFRRCRQCRADAVGVPGAERAGAVGVPGAERAGAVGVPGTERAGAEGAPGAGRVGV